MAPTATAPRLVLPPRAGPALALAAAVLAGHAWLAALLAPATPRAGLPRGAAVQLRSLPPPAAPAALPEPAAPAAVVPPPAPAPAARRSPVTVPRPMPVQMQVPAAEARAVSPKPAAGGGLPALADAAAPLGDAPPTDGEPPPLYATRLPPSVQLRYALHYNGRSGEALLDWQHDGTAYRLALEGRSPDGRPLVLQDSAGRIGPHGLAPDRFTDRRVAGRLRAASFRHDIGRIGYSGPPHTHPAWPGAQDRLSWVAQLAGILGAVNDPSPDLPPELRLFVADATGHAGLWQLQRQPDAPGPTPWGEALLQHWQRPPPRPEGLQVDVWLAAAPGAPSGAWPLRLRFAAPRSGDVFELVLLAAP